MDRKFNENMKLMECSENGIIYQKNKTKKCIERERENMVENFNWDHLVYL